MTQEAPSLITDEMRASIGRESPPVRHEVDKTGIRMFARAVGHTDPIFYDEEAAKARGYRSLVCPPGYLGTTVFNPNRMAGVMAAMGGPGAAGPGGRRMRVLNGGTEYEYTGIPICAGDVLTSVSKTVSIEQVTSSLGPMVITRRESTYTNQNGEVVARSYGTSLNY
ncbi:MAG TPA: MaoC family dehydratase N-terminal domain-containing protein [Dehalococcoidia bacterium]|nr:MaoC family dehydratase N-terminal domain-containing protein [Dehalococcoidia bacterium]